MTDKKLTDEEIIKALEEEIHLAEYVDSDYCCNTEVSLLKSTLDLINRQKAEIEQWQEEANRWQTLSCQEIDDREEIEAEAYKEFANQIKMHKRRMRGFDLCYEFWDYAVSVEDIDNILKTMVGEEE